MSINVRTIQDKLNSLNSRYRFVRLYLDANRPLCSAHDFVTLGDEGTTVKHAVMTRMLFSDIIDKCLLVLLPLTWKSAEENGKPMNVKTYLFHSEGGAA